MNKLFDYKRRYIASDGEEYIDMASRAYNVEKINPRCVNRLNQDHNGRLDRFMFSNSLNEPDDIDLVMYINHIYNPFAVKEGDILYVPSSDNYYYKSEEPTLLDGTKHSDSQISTENRTYSETVEYLAKLGLGIK